MIPTFFSSQLEFMKWLEENHKTENEILVGFYKVSSATPNMTWSQSVDAALCFGWIEGVRTSPIIPKDNNSLDKFSEAKSYSTIKVKQGDI